MYLSSTITINLSKGSHIISHINPLTVSVFQEIQVCSGHWLSYLQNVVVECDVADDHLLSQFEEFMGYGVVVTVVFKVLHKHLLVI